MKLKPILRPFSGHEAKKYVRIMKLTWFLILALTLQTSASLWSQNTKMNVYLKNTTLLELFTQIEKNSQYRFFYSNDEIDVTQRVTVKANDEVIGDILSEAFKELPYSFKELRNNMILVETKTGEKAIGQQQKSVSGKVTDITGEPLPGVTILVKGTTNGTVTNIDGNYAIPNTSENTTLVFSFVGMIAQEIVVGSQTSIDVVLKTDAIGIEDVVVVGYGTQKKVNLTGAVGIAKGEVLENRPITNALEGLQGTVAGLNITNANGEPGSNPKINIRGATSINGGSPLVLVDGIEMNLNHINPNDIESVSVLKDAASAAMYGARAAYGVILVTTKSGHLNQKVKVEYSNNFYAAQPTILAEKSNSLKFALYANEMRRNRGAADAILPEEFDFIKQRINGEINTDWTPKSDGSGVYWATGNTNWSDLVYDKAAPGQNHNVSVSGGSDKISYRLSAGYIDYDGVVKIGNDKYKQFNTNLRMDAKLTEWAKFNFLVNMINSHRDLALRPSGSFGPSIHHMIWRARPTWSPYFEDPATGDQLPVFVRLNPVGTLEQSGRSITNGLNTRYKGGVELKFGDIKVISNFIYNPSTTELVQNNKKIYQVIPWVTDGRQYLHPDGSTRSSIEKQYSIGRFYGFDAYANYEKTFNGKHHVKAMVGFDQRWSISKAVNGFRYDLITEDIHALNTATDEDGIQLTDAFNEWSLRSGFFRVNYSYMDRYLLEVNGRYDGSSRFINKDRFGFFPSVSAGWRLSEEQFMQDISWLDNLKLRASYGSLGNQNVSGLYPSANYGTSQQVGLIINGIRPMGVTPAVPLGDERTWEIVTTANFGVDAILFRGLDFSFDKFTRTTKNMLVSGAALPAVYGATAPQENNADLEVKGWEMALRWTSKIGKVGYYAGFSVSDWKGTITKYDNPTKTFSKAYYEGQDIGEIWGYETVGLLQTEEDVTAYTESIDISAVLAGKSIGSGDVQYADLNGDDKLDRGENTVDNPGDRKIIGNNTPRYAYNINAGIDWKGIDFSVFFQGIGKRDYWLDGPIMFGGEGGYGNMIITDYLWDNLWSDGSNPDMPENRDGYYFRPSEGSGLGTMNYNTQVQTRYLQNASYLRLKNITLGYTLPASITKKVKVSRCRLYISGENLLTFTNLNPNFDPEVLVPNESGQGSVGSSSTSTDGQMGKAYPLTKRISVGMNITF
uniref:SusC/RagA family TonB-linked outer membrane protein n=1 Tax=uncultured Draconibacterium sp. TaxID=1573823 RepID=UPI003217344E